MGINILRRKEYDARGDYHIHLRPDWSFYPTYLSKMAILERVMDAIPPEWLVLDLGCGEGVSVEKYRSRNYHIYGVDINYGSKYVVPGNVIHLPFAPGSVDMVVFFDVIEHLYYYEQDKAVEEIYRILKPGGTLLISAPNLAHLVSRLKFLFLGRLGRTAKIKKHPGDRPAWEYIQLLKEGGFQIQKRYGITLTIPLLTTHLIWKKPTQYLWLHNLLDRLLPLPGLSLLNVFVCQKPTD